MIKGQQMNIPIYRARKLDSDEYVEGLMISNHTIKMMSSEYEIIDQSTLQISFDGTGDRFYNIDYINECIDAIEWMESNSNSCLCDYYNRSEDD